MKVHLVDGVPFLDPDLFGTSSCLRSHKLLQVSNGIVLTADHDIPSIPRSDGREFLRCEAG